MSSEEIKENIESLGYAVEGIETAIQGLYEVDKKLYREYMGTLKDLKNGIELDMEDMEEEYREQLDIEQKEYEEEMKEQNWQYERSRI